MENWIEAYKRKLFDMSDAQLDEERENLLRRLEIGKDEFEIKLDAIDMEMFHRVKARTTP
jgi:hypothetical protein